MTEARAKGYRFTLVNFGCAGATTASVLRERGCDRDKLGPGGVSYDAKTQARAAEDYLSAHRGQVGLVTVSLGGFPPEALSDSADQRAFANLSVLAFQACTNPTLKTAYEAAGATSVDVTTATLPAQ